MSNVEHTVTVWYGKQLVSSTTGNVPLFVPRVGDKIVVNSGLNRLTVSSVEITYTERGVTIDVFTDT